MVLPHTCYYHAGILNGFVYNALDPFDRYIVKVWKHNIRRHYALNTLFKLQCLVIERRLDRGIAKTFDEGYKVYRCLASYPSTENIWSRAKIE